MQTDSQTPDAPERRQWPRLPASMLGDLAASIVSGPEVKLVNLSRGGALIEVPTRYPMRSWVRLRLTRSSGDVTVAAGTVLWSQVASMIGGRINYLMAIAFETPIADLAAATGIREPQADPRAAEHEAELARVRAEADEQRAALEARCRALQERIEELESLCAAHEARYRTLRREAENLAAALAAPVQPESAQAVA